MLRVIEAMMAGGAPIDAIAARVDVYLLIFLKFMSSVVPTIEFDYTTEVKTGVLPGKGKG